MNDTISLSFNQNVSPVRSLKLLYQMKWTYFIFVSISSDEFNERLEKAKLEGMTEEQVMDWSHLHVSSFKSKFNSEDYEMIFIDHSFYLKTHIFYNEDVPVFFITLSMVSYSNLISQKTILLWVRNPPKTSEKCFKALK